MALAKQEAVIELPKLTVQTIQIPIVGVTPLICHAWSQKAKQEMLDKQMKKAKKARVAKDPEQDFMDSLYPHPDGGYGFPAVAFKAAAVSACRVIDGLAMTQVRGLFFVKGELVKINGEPTPREDMVRIGMGTADIRYRAEFKEWSAMLEVEHTGSVLSAEQIVNLFNTAGFHVGVGEWRPEKSGGSYGRFRVATEADEVAA